MRRKCEKDKIKTRRNFWEEMTGMELDNIIKLVLYETLCKRRKYEKAKEEEVERILWDEVAGIQR